MADNFTFTQGSGTTAASDNIGGVHFQRLKVAVGADGENLGDLGGMTVDTSKQGIFVRERPDMREFIPAVTVNTAAYVAGDCIGGLLTISSAVSQAGNWLRFSRLVAATLVDTGGITVWAFDDNPSGTTFTDHAAFPSIAAADISKVRWVQAITAASKGGFYYHEASAVAANDMPAFPLVGTSLYLAIAVTGTPDFVASGDFKLLSLIAERL